MSQLCPQIHYDCVKFKPGNFDFNEESYVKGYIV